MLKSLSVKGLLKRLVWQRCNRTEQKRKGQGRKKKGRLKREGDEKLRLTRRTGQSW